MSQIKLAVTVTEAAQMLSVSRPTVYELLNMKNGISSFKLGSKRLIPVKSLESWIDRQLGTGDVQ